MIENIGTSLLQILNSTYLYTQTFLFLFTLLLFIVILLCNCILPEILSPLQLNAPLINLFISCLSLYFPQFLVIAIIFTTSVLSNVLDSIMTEITSFYAWLIILNIMIISSILVIWNDKILFFMVKYYSIVYILPYHIFFINWWTLFTTGEM